MSNTLNFLKSSPSLYLYKKIVHFITERGKRDKAIKIFYRSLFLIKKNIIEKKDIVSAHQNLQLAFSAQVEEEKKTNSLEGKPSQPPKKEKAIKDLKPLKEKKPHNIKTKTTISDRKQQVNSKRKMRDSSTKTPEIELKPSAEGRQFLAVFQAFQNIVPFLEVRKSRYKRKKQPIPTTIKKRRQQTLGVRWILEGARKRKKKNEIFAKALAFELIEASQKQGNARRQRNEMHKWAQANRANLRFRWW